MKRILIALGSCFMFYGLMFVASSVVRVRGEEIPATPPVTPPTTVTMTPTPTGLLTPTLSPTAVPTMSVTPTSVMPSLTVTPTVSVSPTVPPTPGEDMGDGHTLGMIKASTEDGGIRIMFNARGGEEVNGFVFYADNDNNRFWGKVDECYVQDGNEAAFAGSLKRGNSPEEYFLVEVKDNGKWWKSDEADEFNIRFFDENPGCSLSHNYPIEVDKGNVQVK